MRLTIEFAAAASGVLHHRHQRRLRRRQTGQSADGLSCSFSVPANASPRRAAPRSAPMRRKVLRELLRRQAAVGDVSDLRRRDSLDMQGETPSLASRHRATAARALSRVPQ